MPLASVPVDRTAVPDAPVTFVRRRRASGNPWLHAALFVATFFTLSWTGGLFWAGVAPENWFWPSVIVRTCIIGLPYGFWTIAILTAHEMGHYLACRHYGIPATLPFFIPGPPLIVGSFGALIRIRGRIPDRRALFDVAAAGPIAGFAIALPVLATGYLTAELVPAAPGDAGLFLGTPLLVSLFDLLRPSEQVTAANQLIGAGWVGMLVTSLNLFPVGQLDGGHAAFAISRRLHRLMAYITLTALSGLMLYQIFVLDQLPAYLLWFAILVWMRDRHPPLIDESVPLGSGRIAVACLLLVMLVLAFIPIPLTFIDG